MLLGTELQSYYLFLRFLFSKQLAWVFSGTIQENVLFRRELDAERYRRVMAACGLDKVSIITNLSCITLLYRLIAYLLLASIPVTCIPLIYWSVRTAQHGKMPLLGRLLVAGAFFRDYCLSGLFFLCCFLGGW